MGVRFSFDLGASSIGWAALRLDDGGRPCSIAGLGSMIFHNGRDPDGTPNALTRRLHRQARRGQARTKRRKQNLISLLIGYALLPSDKQERMALNARNPYKLRKHALDHPVSANEFGRILIHLNQRRGFKSNRKQQDGKEEGPIKEGIARLQAAMEERGARTLGELLANRLRQGEGSVRMRPQQVEGSSKVHYEAFASRHLVEQEFDKLWSKQASNLGLDEQQREAIRHAIFWQRPLKPVSPGRCSCDPSELRAPVASPLSERYRILADLNNLRILATDGNRPLSLEERDCLLKAFETKKKVTFPQMRKLLGIDEQFNLEGGQRRDLPGAIVSAIMSAEGCFGDAWFKFDRATQEEIVAELCREDDEDALQQWLQARCQVSAEQAKAISSTTLPAGYGAFSHKALRKIVPLMETEIFVEDHGFQRYLRADEAIAAAGYQPGSVRKSVGCLDRLPYYGELLSRHIGTGSGNPADPVELRFGKIANPTVHIGLNQLRKLVNDLIETYGRPDEIVIELARDISGSPIKKNEIEQQQRANKKRNEAIAKRIESAGFRATPDAIKRVKLWEELNPKDEAARCCIYTGVPISFEMALSGETDIDHIVPRSLWLDNSLGNLILAHKSANRFKLNRTPWQAWGGDPEWAKIVQRAKALPKNKSKRILATVDWEVNVDEEAPRRLLNDTRHFSKVAREYLTYVVEKPQNVWATTGHLTAMLRRNWGLNEVLGTADKNRFDHRHHAVDAFVIGMTDRAMVQRVANLVKREEETGDLLRRTCFPEPWSGYLKEIERAVANIVVYHKPDHAVSGALTEGTNYGKEWDGGEGKPKHFIHKPFAQLSLKDVDNIKDPRIREIVQTSVEDALSKLGSGAGKKEEEKQVANTLRVLQQSSNSLGGIRRVRVYVAKDTAVEVGPKNGRRYVVPGKNHRLEIWEPPDGKWQVIFLSRLEAAKGVSLRPHPAAKRVMRLHKDDLIEIQDDDGCRKVMRVVSLEASAKRIKCCEHHEVPNGDKREKDPDDPFRYARIAASKFQKIGLRKLRVKPVMQVPTSTS